MAKKEKTEKDESDDEKVAKDEESDGDGQHEQDPENSRGGRHPWHASQAGETCFLL